MLHHPDMTTASVKTLVQVKEGPDYDCIEVENMNLSNLLSPGHVRLIKSFCITE